MESTPDIKAIECYMRAKKWTHTAHCICFVATSAEEQERLARLELIKILIETDKKMGRSKE